MTKSTGKIAPSDLSLEERLDYYSMPEPMSGCQLWLIYADPNGYGRMKWDGTYQLAHRLAWKAHRGQIPDGIDVLHKCDVPSCINPDHLFLGTHQDNMNDKVAKGRQSRIWGERSGAHKLTSDQVRAIRVDVRRHKDIAASYGVCQATVAHIKVGRNWRHLD